MSDSVKIKVDGKTPFTVEEHNDQINNVSGIILGLAPYKDKIPAREAIKALTMAITRINELYVSGITNEQNKEEIGDE